MSDVIDYCTGGIVEIPNTEDLTQNVTIQGDLLSGAISSVAYMKQSRGGLISHLRVYVVTNERGPVTVKLVKTGLQPNPAPAALAVSFDTNDSGLFENTSVSIPFWAGDELRWVIEFEEDHYEEDVETKLSYIAAKVEFA